jgi:hypothetical protein
MELDVKTFTQLFSGPFVSSDEDERSVSDVPRRMDQPLEG